MIKMPALPYDKDALAPTLSADAVSFHYDKHTKTYYDTLNTLLDGTVYSNETDLNPDLLKRILANTTGMLFNNAAQAWNHTFFWESLTGETTQPSDELLKEIQRIFGSFDDFKKRFAEKASKHFGSGWVWLVLSNDRLSIKTTSNAITPLTTEDIPLLVVDLWEHAWYVDYPANKAKYIESMWDIVNWTVVSDRYHKKGKTEE